MDYIELARQLSGNTSSAITRKTATATSASTNGTVRIEVGGNNITVPTIGNISKGNTVEYIVQDGMPVAVGTKGAGDALRDNVEGLQTLIRSTDDGVEVAKVNESGGYVGTHTEMTADAFEVHDAGHNKLASFGANVVSIANNNANAKINMCAGTGAIEARKDTSGNAMLFLTAGTGVQLESTTTAPDTSTIHYEDTATIGSQTVSNPTVFMEARRDTANGDLSSAYVYGIAGEQPSDSRLDLKGYTINIGGYVINLASSPIINGDALADHITQSYTSGNWYVERYASGLVKQYWYGLASFATSVGWVAQQAYPVALSAVYSAQATGGDYRVTKLYTAPMEQSGAACYIGGMASTAHQSNVSLCVIGMAAS